MATPEGDISPQDRRRLEADGPVVAAWPDPELPPEPPVDEPDPEAPES